MNMTTVNLFRVVSTNSFLPKKILYFELFKQFVPRTFSVRNKTSKYELQIYDEKSSLKPYEKQRKKPCQVSAYNVAAFVNKSSNLQELVKLGVNLHRIEGKKGATEIILKLDFERDVKKYIQFLHDFGVHADFLGEFITKNPYIFKEDIQNLLVRINYLESKKFTPENIKRIISKNPSWLSFATIQIDDRLGFFQNKFNLEGPEVRHLTVLRPQIITYNLSHIEENHFSVKEEMGFNRDEIKTLVLTKPKIFSICRRLLVERFCYLHSTMGLDRPELVGQPGILLCRRSRLRERHEFLKSLGRAQYNPRNTGYVSPLLAVSNSDAEFCANICKVSVATYNKFLKTLC